MRIYELKLSKPAWFYDPPTNRQIKVLKFFGVELSAGLNKGIASGISARLFRDEENKKLWEKYVYHTGDESQDHPDLVPYDIDELQAVIIPDDWTPKRSKGKPSDRQTRLREMIAEMMREGSPFDEPVPAIGFDGTSFAFTGKFSSGTRSECQEAVENCGAIGQKSVNRSTDFLIIGSEGSDNWAEGSHGRKIEKAMMFRMDTGKPVIVSESDWLTAIQTEKSERIESRKNTNTNSSIELLAELTSSARMNRRSKHLLRDAKDPSNAGWYMHVPTAFNDALDIKFESSGPNMGWTQSGCFAFKQADTLYDTEKAYQKWAEALKEIGMSLVITTASASGVGDGKTRYAGSVTFQVLLPTVNRTRLVEVFDWTMSQDAFVRFLIEGPSGDFEMALAQARNSIAS